MEKNILFRYAFWLVEALKNNPEKWKWEINE